MSDSKNPLDRLDLQELHWLTGILKDACRERLEKNLVSQAFEERLYQRGPVEGRLDPRPFLKIWEPRYRRSSKSPPSCRWKARKPKLPPRVCVEQFTAAPPVTRHGPVSCHVAN